MAKRHVPSAADIAASSAPPSASPAPAPAKPRRRYRTRALWGVLTGLFFAGMAFTILGFVALTYLLGGSSLLLWVPVGLVGLAGMVFCMLLAMGILYRVDRLRGNLVHRIRLFE